MKPDIKICGLKTPEAIDRALARGATHVGFIFFVLSCLIARGARFLALAWALRRFGEPIRGFIERRLGLIAAAAAGVTTIDSMEKRGRAAISRSTTKRPSATNSPRRSSAAGSPT